MGFCSNVKITHGATVLLDFGDKIASNPSVNGQQIVDVVPLLRADAVAIRARGNEGNTLSWTYADKINASNSTHAAARSVISHGLNLPRTKATVKIEFDDGDTDYYELADAVIESWGASWGGTREQRTVNIVGASITLVSPP